MYRKKRGQVLSGECEALGGRGRSRRKTKEKGKKKKKTNSISVGDTFWSERPRLCALSPGTAARRGRCEAAIRPRSLRAAQDPPRPPVPRGPGPSRRGCEVSLVLEEEERRAAGRGRPIVRTGGIFVGLAVVAIVRRDGEREEGMGGKRKKKSKKKMYKLVAIDLDGTLLNSHGEVSESTRKALLEAKEKGTEIVLASGRPISSTESLALELGVDNYLISGNGAAVYDIKNQKVICDRFLSREQVLNIAK